MDLTAGTYTLSAYVKTSNVSGKGAFINAYVWDPTGGNVSNESKLIKGTTDSSINGGWQRLHVTFNVPSTSTYTSIFLGIDSGTGTAWFDAIQLEKEESASKYNMLENASFEDSSNSWDTSSVGSGGLNSSYRKDGTYSYRITGAPGEQRRVTQSVSVNKTGRQTYILSGWARASSVAMKDDYEARNRRFSLTARVHYTTGYYKDFEVPFNPDTSAWQYTSGIIIPDEALTVSTITVYLKYDENMNTAYFDNIYLIEDAAPSYKYDDKGNIVSTRASADQKASFTHDSNNNISKLIDPSGDEYSYVYNSNNNLTKATSGSGIDYYFNYDTTNKGNVTSSRIEKSGYDSKLYSSMTYTTNGNYIDTVTDNRGKVTDYNYNTTNGLLESIKDPNGNQTAYKYNSQNDILEYVYLDANKNNIMDAGEVNNRYVYTNRRLSRIDHNNFSYNFVYDIFGNTSAIKVGTQNLISHSYNGNNGKINKSTYGNGFYTENVYDKLERIIGIKNNGNLDFEWKYDNLGFVTSHIDNVNGVTYDYELVLEYK